MSHAKHSGIALATAAALVFAAAPMTTTQAAEAKIKCEGGNSCKGKSECHTATTGCQGMNKCKGQGFVSLTKKDCDAAKALIKADKKK
ncbi:MAG: hypothetical protein H7Y02_00390 [Candidatus Obscuribacterales bacterium]|nr:hypothetical protein [Steroidobacteraceae bacterium]